MALWCFVTYSEDLRTLAELHGVARSYVAYGGVHTEVSDDTLRKTLATLGVTDTGDEAAVARSISAARIAAATRPLPRCVVSVQGDAHVFVVHVHDGAAADVTIELEEGGTVPANQVDNWNEPVTVDGVTWGEASFATPTDLPLGWHTLRLRSEGVEATCGLVVTPARLSSADRVTQAPRSGVMAQLYSARSRDSWGLGDFHDLGTLAETMAHTSSADFLLINPLHAAEPCPPVEDSPYLPTTRRFVNPIYLRIEDVPEFQALSNTQRASIERLAAPLKATNSTADELERNPIYAAKLEALRTLYAAPRTEAREEAFQEFVRAEGSGLEKFARWCAEFASSHGEAAGMDEASLTTFYCWLQFLCDEQLAAAQARAKAAGMSIGIIADLAVGVHPGGADASNLASVLAAGASVGAPADDYNQQGQDWSQPPWNPEALAEDCYRAWRDMLRTVLRHSGGIRVDHILGLFRLWWIPRMQSPLTGTYVSYDYNALVGILALEAERAGAVVIGEDLGTYEPWVQDVLAGRGILGTSILWFESDPFGPGPRRREHYRTLALTSVTTHDLPPTAGMLQGEHIQLRDRLGLFQNDVATEDANDLRWQNEVLDRAAEYGCFQGTGAAGRGFSGADRAGRGDWSDLLVGLHRYVAGTPSALTCTSLVDLTGDVRAQNQPGTTKDLYPNWCIPLCDHEGNPVLIEDLEELPLLQCIADASRRE